jgi:hypothetical protein
MNWLLKQLLGSDPSRQMPNLLEAVVTMVLPQGVEVVRRAFTIPEVRAREIARRHGADEADVVAACRSIGDSVSALARLLTWRR